MSESIRDTPVAESEALLIAKAYAQGRGYDGVSLVRSDAQLDGAGEFFGFQLLIDDEDDGGQTEDVGLPEVLLVDKLTGDCIETRALI